MQPADNSKNRIHSLPESVNVVRATRAFEVAWDDGHKSSFRLIDLRLLCDCATCRDERIQRETPNEAGGRRTLPVLGLSNRDDIGGVEHVGRYALGVKWRDGHYSIYSYDYLRESCPCEQCSANR
jgi:DUF971 family protein